MTPKFTVFATRRWSDVTSSSGTLKISAATAAWMSWSSANASRSFSSPVKWASNRSSICE